MAVNPLHRSNQNIKTSLTEYLDAQNIPPMFSQGAFRGFIRLKNCISKCGGVDRYESLGGGGGQRSISGVVITTYMSMAKQRRPLSFAVGLRTHTGKRRPQQEECTNKSKIRNNAPLSRRPIMLFMAKMHGPRQSKRNPICMHTRQSRNKKYRSSAVFFIIIAPWLLLAYL